jgi:hypothetical protein
MYRARPGDSKDAHRQAFWLRFDEHLQDWMPPRLARAIVRRRHRLMERSSKT